ncbi:HNH endonuclease [Klebsiella variicola]|uniref:HNH endonuclease n=1 Tax=Klebsiella variicola TaxID=244366 RepID=UPI00109C69E1
MAKLKTLKPRTKVINTYRVKPLHTADTRLTGSKLYNIKYSIHARDGGRCCLCDKAVSYEGSNLDHRIALQFGGTHDESNLWTLCITCHNAKSARERRHNMPDEVTINTPLPNPAPLDAARFNMV